MGQRILVIGGTGRVGSELVKLLVQNGERVRVATRNPAIYSSKLYESKDFSVSRQVGILQNDIPKISVEVVEFDYERPETFGPALEGVEKIFLTVRPGDNHSDEAAAPLIELAKKGMVKHIVALTAMGVEQDETFMLRILEKNIESSGIAYTHLRPNWFMQNLDSGPMYADIKRTGALHLPAADAEISFIDVRDIAAVGFAALTETKHEGMAYTLTGKEALNFFQVVEKISRAIKKEIPYVPLSEENAREALKMGGIPTGLIERWTDFYRKVRQGLCSPVSEDAEAILGRAPILFDQYVNDYAKAWKQE
jgi:uncharacterized protein YbjT (DUF2867 family)